MNLTQIINKQYLLYNNFIISVEPFALPIELDIISKVGLIFFILSKIL